MTPKSFRLLHAIVFNLGLAGLLLLYRAELLEQAVFVAVGFVLFALLAARVLRDPDGNIAVPIVQLLALTTVLQVISLRADVAPGIDNLIDYTLARAIDDNGWRIGEGEVIDRYEIPFPFLHLVALTAAKATGISLAWLAFLQPLITSKASILMVVGLAALMFRRPGIAMVPALLFAMSWPFLDFHSWFAKEGLALPLMLALLYLDIAAALRDDVRYLAPTVPLALAIVLTQTLVAVFAIVILVALFISTRLGAFVTRERPSRLTWPLPLLLLLWLGLYWSILSNSPFDWFLASFEALTTEGKLRFLESAESTLGQRLVSMGSMGFAVGFFALALLQTPRLIRERRFIALGFVVVGGFAGLLAMVFTVFALYRGSGTVSGGRFLLFSALGSILPLGAPLLDDRRIGARVVVTSVLLVFALFNLVVVPVGKYAPQDHDDPGLASGLTSRWTAMAWLDGVGLVGIQGAYQAALPLWKYQEKDLDGYDVADFFNAGGFDYVILRENVRSQYESSVQASETNVLYDNGPFTVMR